MMVTYEQCYYGNVCCFTYSFTTAHKVAIVWSLCIKMIHAVTIVVVSLSDMQKCNFSVVGHDKELRLTAM